MCVTAVTLLLLYDENKPESSLEVESKTRREIPQTACCKARARLVGHASKARKDPVGDLATFLLRIPRPTLLNLKTGKFFYSPSCAMRARVFLARYKQVLKSTVG